MLDAVRSKLGSSSFVKPLYAGEDHTAALIGPALVTIARREPDEAIVDECPRWVDQLLAAHPAKGIYLVVVQTSAPPPGEAARRRIDRVYREYERGVVAGAMVIEGKGFMAASIRSALALLMLTSKYAYPLRTFATVREGASFLSSKLPMGVANTQQLASGVEDLRAAYEAQVGVFTAGSAAR